VFIDARTLASEAVVEADICIVGAGAAGITLARALANDKLRIALFESGGLDFDPETQEFYAGENVGRPCPPLDVDRLRYFGGTTNHWSGGCNPFHESDFQDWPFGRRELDPYYRIAQTVCQLGPYSYVATDWETATSNHIDFGPSARFVTGMYQSNPTRFGEVYRQDLEQSKQVLVYLYANLVEIEATANSAQISGLQFSRLDRKRFSARGRYFVLATGAIENARLLLCSTKSSPNGIGNKFDLVGRYFMDHGVVRDYASILFSDVTSGSFYRFHDVRGQHVSGYFYATPETAEKERLPPFCISLTLGHPDTDLAPSSLNAIYQNLKMGRLPPDYSTHVGNIYEAVKWKLETWKRRLLATEPSHFATLYIAGAAPNPESRVTLTDSVDALGLRRIKLDWRLPSDFDEKMRRAHEILASELGRAGLGRLHVNPEHDILNAHHHMGTTRMHREPNHGVVDENCRVHGIENLFIAGSSVFPSYSFDDPTMTIVALALRLADRLKALAA
jgi:choline dehydrogenase-like flavoprotein